MVMLTSTTHDEIKFACRTYHYAHCIPSVSYGYNVFNERYEWCGVILFGTGATPNIGKPFGMEQSEVVELVRVALNGLQPCTSECVAAALKQLHEDAPQIKIVVSYADADQNHYGTIYQATNWIYLGMKEQNALGAFIIHGKKVHRRTIGSAGGRQNIEWVRKNLDPNAQEFRSKGKRKYIYVFNRKLRKKWQAQAQPYPKRKDDTL